MRSSSSGDLISVPAYILAGGNSSRFGSDKARAIVHGIPLISGIDAALRESCSAVTVVGRHANQYSDLGLQTIADRCADQGPLGGLDAALADRSDGWLLLTSCDFVKIEQSWISRLSCGRRDRPAVAFRGARWEPLFALYNTEVAAVVSRHLQEGTLAMWRLLDEVNATALPLPDDWPTLAHVNSELELRQALSQDLMNQEHDRGKKIKT
ncbi:MAG TPA: molybdenum cofactor guanylyltransferase [Tepidisphaeraceae bacterium]|nr:molybdenum cofactor guanylyltransferase [Tepidisphaeraceae bacterium]